MEKEIQEKIHDMITSLIEKMGVDYSIDVVEYLNGIKFNIRSNEGRVLIADGGANLAALNHIIHRIADKERIMRGIDEHFHFLVDVNDYHKQRFDSLNDLASMSAQRVRYFKKEVEMDPMSAFERRIIHTTLMEYPDITTESTGEGAERRVVIKPF